MSKVTVCTYAYNRPNLLCRAIESVLAQSFTNFEYLIVNNAFTDDIGEIIDRYAKIDKRIKTIKMPKNYFKYPDYEPNLPFIKQMEDILYKPHNEYITFIDDDDYMEVDTIETLVNLIEDYNADIAAVGSKLVFSDGNQKDKYVFDGIYEFNRIEAMTEMLKREKFNVAPGGKLYRKEICDLGLSGKHITRDIYLEYRRINKINKMVISGVPKYYFYRHHNNMSGLNTKAEITPQMMCMYLESNSERTKFLAVNMPEIKEFAHYCELSFMISLYQRIYNLKVEDCYDIANNMLGELKKQKEKLNTYQWLKENEIAFLRKLVY